MRIRGVDGVSSMVAQVTQGMYVLHIGGNEVSDYNPGLEASLTQKDL